MPSAPTFSEDLNDPPPTGRSDDPLEERRVLGRGGLGEVVECFDPVLRRVVALKRPLDASPSSAAGLIREAQVTGQLVHASVPAVHALGEGEDGRPWFTMTRLSGRTLDQLLRDGLVRSVGWRVRIVVQVAQAVAFAHSRGVIHRDLKPANVFLGEFGEVTVVDWGIALVRGDPANPDAVQTTVPYHPTPGRFAGSPQYAAPEQLRGDVDLDPRVDVYALGGLLFTLLTGKAPIDDTTGERIRERVLAGEVADPGHAVPAALAAVIRRAMAPDRERRYPDAVAMIADLEAFLDGRALASGGEAPATALIRWYSGQLRRVSRLDVDLLVTTGGALGALVVTSILWWWPHDPLPWVVASGAVYLAVSPYTLNKTASLWHGEGKRGFDRRVFVFLVAVAMWLGVVLSAATR
jgi:serine/threonine protein kinase